MRKLVFTALGLLCACGSDLPFDPAGPNAAPDPSTFGPYAVGVRTMTLTDPFREDRTLTVEVWYPADESARGGPGVSYQFKDFLPDEFIEQLEGRDVGGLDTSAVRDAPLYDDTFPLVVFSHGSGALRVQSTYATVPLASHGYVVVAPDHVGNTIREAESVTDPSNLLQSVIDRPADVSFLIDRFTNLTDDPLGEVIDGSQIGVFGHSFGGVTAIRTAGFDDRIKASVAHAPAGYLATWVDVPRELDSLGIPIMVQEGLVDRTIPMGSGESLWVKMGAPRYRLSFDYAGHFTWSDLCAFDRDALDAAAEDLGIGNVLSDGCGPENLKAQIAFPIIRHYTIGLFNAYLRESPGTLENLDKDFGRPDFTFMAEP